MINKPIALILGAGASHPYGFQLGRDLLRDVWEVLGNSSQFTILQEIAFSIGQIKEFEKALRHADPTSLDSFLGYRDEFLEIGKACIAYVLIQKELPQQLFNPRTSESLQRTGRRSNGCHETISICARSWATRIFALAN